MSDTTSSPDSVLARVREPASTLRARFVELVVDAALDRPASEGIDPDRVVALVSAAVDEERVEKALRELARPTFDRQRAHLAKSGETLGAWLPAGSADLLDEIAAGTRKPQGAWARTLVDPAHVRELLAPVLQDTLLAFARKLPLVSGAEESKAGKLLGGLARGIAQSAGERARRVGESAAKIADIGRGVLGGLGAEMEKRVAASAREFSQGAFEPLRGSFEERLTSEEGQAILAKMRRHAIDAMLEAKVAELVDDLDAAPRESLDKMIARAVAHGVAKPEAQEILRAEVAAFLAAREGRTLRELLDEWGLLEEARADALRLGGLVADAAVQSEAFEAWLRDLLA